MSSNNMDYFPSFIFSATSRIKNAVKVPIANMDRN